MINKNASSLSSLPSNPTFILQYLESLLRSANEHFRKILISPYGDGERFVKWRAQYKSRTIFLFNALFKLVCCKLDSNIIEKSTDVQSGLLRILILHNKKSFEFLVDEYMAILDEVLDFDEIKESKKSITINRLINDSSIDDNINLQSSPIVVMSTSILDVQIFIMKIIKKTDSTHWNQDKLWPRLLRMLQNSEPEGKLMALEIVSQFLEFNTMERKRVELFVSCISIIVSNFSNWKARGKIHLWNLLVTLLDRLMISEQVINLCFTILDTLLIDQDKSKILELKICEKIQDGLVKQPRSYTPDDAKRFIKYLEKFPEFYKVINHYFVFEIQAKSAGHIDLTETSQLWRLYSIFLTNKMMENKVFELVDLLKCPRNLSTWLVENKIECKLFNDPGMILQYFLDKQRIEDDEKIQFVYLCLNEMMAIKDFDKIEIQKYLSLPWLTKETSASMNLPIESRLLPLTKSLSTEIKIKCLKSISKYGHGKNRINYLSVCITNSEVELGVAAVLNSIFLLQDNEIKFVDISTHILRPALVGQRLPLREAVAKIFGPIVCFLSGKAIFKKQIWDSSVVSSSDWNINCKVCDREELPGLCERFPIDEGHLSSYLGLLSSVSQQVRENMSNNYLRLSNHLKVFNENKISILWLPHLGDTSLKVRTNLSNSIVKLVENKIKLLIGEQDRNIVFDNGLPRELDEFVESIMEKFCAILDDALENSKESQHITLLSTAKQFARVHIDEAERRICNIFIITMIHHKASYNANAEALFAYQEVAEFAGLTPRKLYTRYKKEVISLMMRLAGKNYLEISNNLLSSLRKVTESIGFPGVREFFEHDGELAVCCLVPMALDVPEIDIFFAEIAYLTTKDEKMFQDYFRYIFPYIFFNEGPERGIKCLKKIEQITKQPLKELVSFNHIVIFRELFIYFHDHTETVLTCLELISQFDLEFKGEKSFKTKQDIAMYLKSNLHGVLVLLDTNLGPTVDQSTQKAALSSLGSLMKYMGPEHLSPLRFKILTSLRTSLGLTRPGFKKLSCYAWDCFIRNIPMKDLGPLLSTIVVSMIPLIRTCRKEVMEILKFIFIEKQKEALPYMSEVFFIEDLKVDDNITEIVMTQIEKSMPKKFEHQLAMWLERIRHETHEVEFKALNHLQIFLKNNRNDLNTMILKETNAHPLIGELLDTLLAGCQDKKEKIRLKCGECIGELGAVDPSLRGRKISTRNDIIFIKSMINDNNFIVEIINVIVKSIQMEKSVNNNSSFALAIQEILKYYKIKPLKINQVWNALTSTCQQIISPFLESRYKMTSSRTNKYDNIIYGSENGSTFDDWLLHWINSMINCISDDKLYENEFLNLLDKFRPALRRDTRISIFLIPFLFTCIVTTGTDEDRQRLINEIFAVINISEKKMDKELFIWRPLYKYNEIEGQNTNRISDEARRIRCSQAIFNTLDYAERWMDECCDDKNWNKMNNFIGQFDNFVLATACYELNDYHRSLMYLERHMKTKKKGLSDQNEMSLMAKIYTQLEEPDGVYGILSTQDQLPSLEQRVITHKVNGQLQDAAICYERLVQKSLEPKYVQGLIDCYINLDRPFTAMEVTRGILNKFPEYESFIESHETFWRLADFQQLDENHEKNTLKTSLLDDLKNSVQPNLQDIKKKLILQLGTASHEGAYQQNYSCIMKFHVLNEFEKATGLMINGMKIPEILKEWRERDQLIRTSRNVGFVLSMRRATLDLAVKLAPDYKKDLINEEIGKIWLKSAKIARKSGLYQQAYMYILSASDYCQSQELSIEQAQLYWQKGCQDEAFTTLRHLFSVCSELEKQKETQSQTTATKGTKNYAKAKLLFAKYNDETLNVDPNTNIKYYKDTINIVNDWEKSHLMYAQYTESYFERMTDKEKFEGQHGLKCLFEAFHSYGKSLSFGCKYIHQSMPIMLSLWLDFSQKYKILEIKNDHQKCIFNKMLEEINIYRKTLPTYIWLTALSQLVSRICHPETIVRNTIIDILIDLIWAHPHYCLWMMVEVFNSKLESKQSAARIIINSSKLKKKKGDLDIFRLMKSFGMLGNELIKLSTNEIIEKQKNLSSLKITDLNPQLPLLFKRKGFGPIMMPTSKFFQVILPLKGQSQHQHKPFQNNQVSILGVEEDVTILSSLVRPTRIAFRGSDGYKYLFMVKPKDDLRRDSRVMEFITIVNNYLQKNPESRQRRLYIRTYSVVPLSENCGIIEWLRNLVGFRPTLTKLYKAKKIGMSQGEIRKVFPQDGSIDKRKRIFLTTLLPKHPPILSEFFRKNFPDPYSWYEARAAYIRTTAVMSMVGYIVGLGDRHGENLSIDCKNGDCVHVDFNCLFNTGEKFQYPERVPFRLTQNMISAMGPLGYEGPFRKSCETTLRVLRQQASTLISILTPFVYTEKSADVNIFILFQLK